MHALSIKQPWAALLAHGLKTIEVRRWPTARRERLLIHAARVPDERAEAWGSVPAELQAGARQLGGIVGAADLIDCKSYHTPRAFVADCGAHLNPASWFQGPVLYGFRFANAISLPFHPCHGWMRFFPVDDLLAEPVLTPPGSSAAAVVAPSLLVSVRTAEEVEATIAGGASIIDIKEPRRGSLGRASDQVITAVVERVAGRRRVSAALGELLEELTAPSGAALNFAKWGLAGCGACADWRVRWRSAAGQLRERSPQCFPVAVAYADWERADAPPPAEVLHLASECGAPYMLIDTWKKDRKTLLDWMTPAQIAALIETSRAAGVGVVLAGSLGAVQMLALRDPPPDFFAVRGAACADGKRKGVVDCSAVRFLAELISSMAVTSTARGS